MGSKYYQNPLGYALDRFAFYKCYKCKNAYFGGMRACGAAGGGDGAFEEKNLVCGSCSAGNVGVARCKTHGKNFIEFKCKFCCSVAVWFCFGTTHFCEPCHKQWGRAPGKLVSSYSVDILFIIYLLIKSMVYQYNIFVFFIHSR